MRGVGTRWRTPTAARVGRCFTLRVVAECWRSPGALEVGIRWQVGFCAVVLQLDHLFRVRGARPRPPQDLLRSNRQSVNRCNGGVLHRRYVYHSVPQAVACVGPLQLPSQCGPSSCRTTDGAWVVGDRAFEGCSDGVKRADVRSDLRRCSVASLFRCRFQPHARFHGFEAPSVDMAFELVPKRV